MPKKNKSTISFKIEKEDYELKAIIRFIEKNNFQKSDVIKKALKFYVMNYWQKGNPDIEKMILEAERKDLFKQMLFYQSKIKDNGEKLTKLGVDLI